MKKFLLALIAITTFQISFGQNTPSIHKSKALPKNVLTQLTNNIMLLKESDQYLAAQLYEVFTRAKKCNIEQAEIEIENIATSKEDQKFLFDYWHDYMFNQFPDPYSAMLRYFENALLMNENNARILTNYIENLDYLSPSEKKSKIDKANAQLNIQ
jgi:hypothetical protein